MSSGTATPRRRIRRTLRLARRLMPSDGDLAGFLHNLSRHRRRPLTLIEDDTSRSLGRSGLCLVTDKADYIFVEPATSPSRRATIICHEISHLLLGHEGDSLAGVASDLAPDLEPGLVARMLARHSYTSPAEEEAEIMATMLVAEHTRRQHAASRTTGDFRVERLF